MESSPPIPLTPSPQPTEQPEQFTVGVLIVHGIGDQKVGESLIDSARSLFDWFQRKYSGSDHQISITESHLVSSDEVPASTCFEIITKCSDCYEENSLNRRRLLIAEGLWAKSFYEPKFAHLVQWSFFALPSVVANQFTRGMLQIFQQAGYIHRYPSLLLRFLGHFGLLFFAVVIQLSVISLLPLALIPLLRSSVLAIQNLLASFLGDSFIFVSDPIQRNGILTQVSQSLDWLEKQQCDRIAILAHSQGAAVAYEVLKSPLSNRHKNKISLFLTYGSGLGKLSDLRFELDSGDGRNLLGFIFLLSSTVILSLAPEAMRQLFLPTVQRTPDAFQFIKFGITFPIIQLLLIFYFQKRRLERFGLVAQLAHALKTNVVEPKDERLDKDKLNSKPSNWSYFANTRHRAIRWLDCYATKDIVPAGPLLDVSYVNKFANEWRDFPESQAVTNKSSLIMDHVSYWDNLDEFVTIVASALETELGITVPLSSRIQFSHISCRRKWRYAFRQSVFWLFLLEYAALIWHFRSQLPEQGEFLLDVLRRIWLVIPDWLYDKPDIDITPLFSNISGIVQIGAVFLALWVLLRSIWTLWQRRDVDRILRKNDIDAGGWPFILFIVATIVLLAFPIAYFLYPNIFTSVFDTSNRASLAVGCVAWTFASLTSSFISAIPGGVRKFRERVYSLLPISGLLLIPLACLIVIPSGLNGVVLMNKSLWGQATFSLSIGGGIIVFSTLLFFLSLVGKKISRPLLELSIDYGGLDREGHSNQIFWFGPTLGIVAVALKKYLPISSFWVMLAFLSVCTMGVISVAYLSAYGQNHIYSKGNQGTLALAAALSGFVTSVCLVASTYF